MSVTTTDRGRTRPVRVSDSAHAILSHLSEVERISIPDVIENLAKKAEWEEICRSEREAFAADLKNEDAIAEYALWDETNDDID
jgi:hypothetical protein